MKTTVIYHSADYDGIFCREVAKKFLPKDSIFIGWNHGEAKIPMPDKGVLYILDLPHTCIENLVEERTIIIDHHKSEIDLLAPKIAKFKGTYLIDGVAACRLTWQWFESPIALPEKELFIERKVMEPEAIRLAGEYDIWEKSDPNVDLFQLGLNSLKTIDFELLLSDYFAFPLKYIKDICNLGNDIKIYIQNQNKKLLEMAGTIISFEGLKFLAVNNTTGNSLTFESKDIPETNHDALMKFYWSGQKWIVSLYHAKDKKEIDLSIIASKYGGGGHRGACGFSCEELPFKLKE